MILTGAMIAKRTPCRLRQAIISVVNEQGGETANAMAGAAMAYSVDSYELRDEFMKDQVEVIIGINAANAISSLCAFASCDMLSNKKEEL